MAAALLLVLFPVGILTAEGREAAATQPRDSHSSRARGLEETYDDLRAHGFPITLAMTVIDAASDLDIRQQPGLAAPLRGALRQIVDLAVYTAEGPDENAAKVAWDANTDVRFTLRQMSNRRESAPPCTPARSFSPGQRSCHTEGPDAGGTPPETVAARSLRAR